MSTSKVSKVRGTYFRSCLLSRLGERKPLDPSRFKPYVYRNRQRLEDAHETAQCAFCSYQGPSITFVPPEGKQGPAQLVYAGEGVFTRALEQSTPTCANCYQDQRRHRPAKSKAPLVTRPVRTISVLQDMLEESRQKNVVTDSLHLQEPVVVSSLPEAANLFSEVHAAVSALASEPSRSNQDEAQSLTGPEANGS